MTVDPTDDPGRLRASDADRERVARVLNTAMAEGRITAGELDERLQIVYGATTVGELVPVTRDLPAHQSLAAAAAPPAVVNGPASGFVGAIMSGATRQGAWLVPARLTALSMMGGVVLDLTQARFAAAEVTVTAVAIMGGIDIIVPDGITVISNGTGLFGGFDDRTPRSAQPTAGQVVRVNGVAIMGGVDIHRPASGRVDLSK